MTVVDEEIPFDPYQELFEWLRRCGENGLELPAQLVFAADEFLKDDPLGRADRRG